MRDQTAEDVAARRRLESRLLDVFGRWGYEEAGTPTLEYLDTLLHGAGPGIGDRLLKLVDAGGEVLALRPEMTVPLARFAATRLLAAGRTSVRLSYAATVYRGQERGSGRMREFTQAGVELIGERDLHADVEVVALAAEALHAAGVQQAVISVGHAGFLRGILSTLPDDAAEAARDLLYRRAFADLNRVVPAGRALDALRTLPTLRGPEALDRAEPLAQGEESGEALETLRAVLDGVAAYGPAVRVGVDLGLVRDFDYYSGVVFEAHGPRPGMPLLGGGRYDGLLARFGREAPATGFAMGIEPVLEAAGEPPAERVVVAVRCPAGGFQRAVRVAAALRAAGVAAVITPAGKPGDAVRCVVDVGETEVRVEAHGREIVTAPDDVVDVVRRALESR
jgi:ATP phosphoribosyltransferase regulatory subunit